VPIKLRLNDCNGSNTSSAALQVTAFDLRLVGGTTSSAIADPGNSQPDNNFRFVGSDDGSYQFNLKTTGLSAGTYKLFFNVGNRDNPTYSVQFEVR
jgi:hypothetical protein